MVRKPTYEELERHISELEMAGSELLKTQKLLRAAENLAGLGSCEWHIGSDTWTVSDGWQAIHGCMRSRLSLREYSQFACPEDRSTVEKALSHAAEHSQSCGLEYRVIRQDNGEMRSVAFSGTVETDDSRRAVRMLGVVRDITEKGSIQDISRHKQAESALLESEQKWRNILVNSPQIAITLDTQAKIVFANAHFLKLTGWEEKEVIGRDWFELFIPENIREEIGNVFHTTVARNDLLDFNNYENEIITRSGEIRNVAWFNVLTKDTEGKVVEVTCLGVDLTERYKVEEELRESEERFRLLLNDVEMVSVQGYGPDGTTQYWNKGSCRLYGYTAEEAIGRNLLDLIIPPEMRDEVRGAIEKMAKTGMPIPSSELSLMRKDGSRVAVYSSHGIVQRQGRPRELFCIDIDLSEMKKGEEERDRLRALLMQSQKIESIGRLAGGVAHDFNNMLNVILGHVDLMIEDLPPGDPLCADLLEIQNAARHSADLTRQLLAFARRQHVAPKILDMNTTIKAMLKMLRRLIGENIELVWQPSENLGPVYIDPTQINQMLANLLVNARDAIDGIGSVTIRTGQVVFNEAYCSGHSECKPGSYIMLTVSDDGPGMDEQTLRHIFEPFFTTKDIGEGTGLGLATVYGIVHQNNGSIDVHSEPGRGTSFYIYLPVVAEEREEQAGEKAERIPQPRDRKTILLVEDEPSILMISKRMLEKQGFRVLDAALPSRALELAEKHAGEIDLLLTDMVMPEMNGRQLAQELRSRYPDIKCLYMSGYASDVGALQGEQGEDIPFLQKPFSMKQLTAGVYKALGDD
jgi:PAS domain S-box-containing protein